MPPREELTGSDFCSLASRWTVDALVMHRVVAAADSFFKGTGRRVSIISGFRTLQEQLELGRRGRPTAAPDRSTHLSCPATGVDISISGVVTTAIKQTWGRFVLLHGLRWGGGSPVDASDVPSDWQHVDNGARG